MRPPGLALLLLVACAHQASRPPQPEPAKPPQPVTKDLPIPADLAAEVTNAQSVGRQLYLLDKVSAIGTDVLMANVTNPKAHGLRGYVTFQDGDEGGRPKKSFTVSFFTGDPIPLIAFTIQVAPDSKPVFETIQPPRPAPPSMQELIRARQTALQALPDDQRQPINPVILPARGGQEVLVYLLAGTTRPGIAVLGRHHRVRVSPDGRQILRAEPLSRSILELPTRPPPNVSAKALEGLVVSHLVSQAPLETHVFVSLLHKMPVYVVTSRGHWRVDGDRIGFMKEAKR